MNCSDKTSDFTHLPRLSLLKLAALYSAESWPHRTTRTNAAFLPARSNRFFFLFFLGHKLQKERPLVYDCHPFIGLVWPIDYVWLAVQYYKQYWRGAFILLLDMLQCGCLWLQCSVMLQCGSLSLQWSVIDMLQCGCLSLQWSVIDYSKLAFWRRKISEPGSDVLNVRLRSYRVRSCQIGLFTCFQKGFSLKGWMFSSIGRHVLRDFRLGVLQQHILWNASLL